MDNRQRPPAGPKRPRRPRVPRPKLFGRHPLSLGAAALLAVSGYELWVRLEDFWAWTSGIRHLSKVRGTPFIQDLGIVFEAPEMRALGYKLLFLALAALFSVACLILRNRPRWAWALLALDVALAVGGGLLGLYSYRLSDWLQALKLLPLALIAAGCVANIVHHASLRRPLRREASKGVAKN